MAHRIQEKDVIAAVRNYLFEAGGEATIRQIRRALPRYLDLSPVDRRKSATRQGEELWEQQVRNIVCHRTCDDNPIKNGDILYRPGRLALRNGPQESMF
jgi:hypothetical protein